MKAAASGRPLRFFGLVMAGWVAIRLTGIGGDMVGPAADAELREARATAAPAAPFRLTAQAITPVIVTFRAAALSEPKRYQRFQQVPLPVPIAEAPTVPNDAKPEAAPPSAASPSINPAPALPLANASQPRAADRWHGSSWLYWREGSATPADAVTGGRLGGSQAGFRVDFDLTPGAPGRAAAYGRMSAAMNRPASPEAALGLAWQPVRAIPVSLAAERRTALGKGARNANALLLVGGIGPASIAPSLEVEAYAQGGMVGFRARDLFGDGKISLLSPLKGAPVKIGASISGGAQPNVERLDVGPELQLRLPLQPIAARLSVEWRERIAGNAAPPSGLAVTLGADF